MTPRVLDWTQAYHVGRARCGGKGGNLARLARYGFPVPAGGVLTADAYTDLMRRPDLASHAAELASVAADDTLNSPVTRKLQELRAALAAAAGRATGPCRIIRHTPEGTALAPGEIPVAPSTDPGWTPLFLRAAPWPPRSGVISPMPPSWPGSMASRPS